ncbi:hypothetical protein NC653_000952 [Populus alba x Populus x berolinensis]|uniref:Uncharacterized protein n=1 Tax=Populus alba x Populus x berolinensis TaxID=444605 RepID=A0AAD6RJU5_9ROSI|nr:hypothetical protein NC653_000952 [Populus alba x Populus x berolinensis]
MGLVVVISLPLIIFCLLLGFGCYYLGMVQGKTRYPYKCSEPLTTPKSFPDTPCQDGCLINVAFWLQKPAGWTIICSVPSSPNNIIILSQADTNIIRHSYFNQRCTRNPSAVDGLRQFCLEKPCAMLMTSFFTCDDVFPRQDTEYFPSYMPYQLPWHPPVPLIPFNTSHATKSYSLSSNL